MSSTESSESSESSENIRAWGVVALPAVCAAALYAWSAWCFGGASAPSTTVAISVGGAAILAAAVAYFLLVDGAIGLFGALALVGGLLLTVAAADQAASRGAVAACVVVEVREEERTQVGEGGATTVVYHHTLRCPGGYPSTVTEAHRAAPDGGEVRVAYDPRQRVAPALEGSSSPLRQAVLAMLLLAAATAGARRFSRRGRPAA
ncbi:hypothetical protein [Streptomyces sp. NPDC058667]|uniref:hypothetical protein n=1 Tax=Streptomyces sp. NPDC058667 TaxID=3346588 RepID=UPI0036593B27